MTRLFFQKDRIVSALVMLLLSAVPIAGSHFYRTPVSAEELGQAPAAWMKEQLSGAAGFLASASELRRQEEAQAKARQMTEEAPQVWQPQVGSLNLAHVFPEGTDTGDPASSYAAMAYQELMQLEEQSMHSIRRLSGESPAAIAARLGLSDHGYDSFRNIQIAAVDGDGNPVTSFTNVPEIMSMASVYTYYKNPQDYDSFMEYARQLWNQSHSYTCRISDVYTCSGCLDGEDDGEEEATPADAASVSNASQDMEEGNCPGHIDLIVQIKVVGLNGTRSLFSLDSVGNDPSAISESGWSGWTDENREFVQTLHGQDWSAQYGITTYTLSAGDTLSTAEIASYMAELPDGLSPARQSLIRFALESVGRVPYYWGGKASRSGYEGNRFGAMVSPDPEGRILKGLDCSGWISWIYWSVTGNRLDFQSTAGMTAVGTPITKEELQPGDILFRTGDNAHAILFLNWTEDGRIRCIHESSDGTNNVTISIKKDNWQYYRRLVE